jgi:hypothetical protein
MREGDKANKKFWEELIACFPLIRHVPYRKQKKLVGIHRHRQATQMEKGQENRNNFPVMLFSMSHARVIINRKTILGSVMKVLGRKGSWTREFL